MKSYTKYKCKQLQQMQNYKEKHAANS